MKLEDLDWRDIPGYDGMYQLSRMGEVRTWRYRKDRRLKAPRLLVQYMIIFALLPLFAVTMLILLED